MQKYVSMMTTCLVALALAACSHGSSSSIPSMSTGGTLQTAPQVAQSAATRTGTLTRVARSIIPPAGWAATNTVGISLQNATPTGALGASTPMTIAVALALRDPAGAQALAKAVNDPGSASYGNFVTPDSFTAQFGPTSDQVASVVNYLTSKGFTNIQPEPNNLFVVASGTAAQVQSAFNTTLSTFNWNGMSVFANTAPALVPASLSGTVLSVLGLNNAAVSKTTPHKATGLPCDINVQNNCIRSYNAAGWQLAYDAGNSPTGANTTIAVISEGNVSQTVTDLRTFEQKNGLPQVPVSIVQVGIPTIDTAGVTEWDIDSQSSTGIAGNVKHLYFYVASSLTDQDLALDLNRWATQNVAKIANASLGICEVFPYIDGSMVADDMVFLQAAAQGQTLFASTGDTGSSCAVEPTNGVPGSGPPLVEYPAASPYVVAVGGTTLLTHADGTYDGEASWNAGGGGISQFEGSPYWQASIVPVGPQCSCRTTPDIAMDADPNTGIQIYNNGAPSYWGGTSLASPLAMGVYARAQTAHGNRLGFASPRLYGLFASSAAGAPTSGNPPTIPHGPYHDIITGSNGLYPATPGYDYDTGLGTLDIALLVKAI